MPGAYVFCCAAPQFHSAHAACCGSSQVSLNTVDNLESFVADIQAGRWDVILPQARSRSLTCVYALEHCFADAITHTRAQMAQMQLPRRKMEDLYEQVVLVRAP